MGCAEAKQIDRLQAENDRLLAENERLRAKMEELQVREKVQLAPTSPEKPEPASEEEAKMLRAIEEQAKHEDKETRCAFYCLAAKQLMAYPGQILPKYQDLLRDHPQMFVKFEISFVEACAGVHVETVLTISHRWMDKDVADIDGAQLAAIRKYLAGHPEILLVWVDYSCMPQGIEKTVLQIADFKRMIHQINLLYLGTSVLILLDLSYLSRFWTQFEAWLSMQQATTGKLCRAVGSQRRETIVTIYNGTQTAKLLLQETWADVSPDQAMEVLATPDVTVTNQNDKTTQIERLKVFAANVQQVNTGGVKLVMGIERAVGPKPKERTWRDEWLDASMENNQLLGGRFLRSSYAEGGMNSIEERIQDFAGEIKWLVDHGWPREQAEACCAIMSSLPAPLAAAVRDKSDRYAASTHVVYEAFAEQAKRLTEVAPPLYSNLTGKFGLATVDPAWQALLQPGASAGFGFVTNGLSVARRATSSVFPDDKGYCVSVNCGSKVTFQLQDSDVVCVRSAPADAEGYHSMIQTSAAGFRMPPLATVTFEKVDGPGEWEVRGLRVQRRLFTVSVSYK